MNTKKEHATIRKCHICDENPFHLIYNRFADNPMYVNKEGKLTKSGANNFDVSFKTKREAIRVLKKYYPKCQIYPDEANK